MRTVSCNIFNTAPAASFLFGSDEQLHLLASAAAVVSCAAAKTWPAAAAAAHRPPSLPTAAATCSPYRTETRHFQHTRLGSSVQTSKYITGYPFFRPSCSNSHRILMF